MGQTIIPGHGDVLVVVDVQNGFMPGGSLPVPDGDAVIPVINRLARAFRHVVITQDWHTKDHISFASRHPGKKPFDTIELPYGPPVLWPDHCIQGTIDAELHKDLSIPQAALIIRKGFRPSVDSYSAFLEADRTTMTGLSPATSGSAASIALTSSGSPLTSASRGRPWTRGAPASGPR